MWFEWWLAVLEIYLGYGAHYLKNPQPRLEPEVEAFLRRKVRYVSGR